MFIYLLSVAAGSFIVIGIVAVLFLISAFGWMKTFEKAGVAGWKAFIPILNDYEKFMISGFGSKAFIIWLILSIVTNAWPDSSTQQFTQFLGTVVSVLFIIYDVNLNVKLSNSFGKGTGFGLVLWFFPFIGSYILGFGSSRYDRSFSRNRYN